MTYKTLSFHYQILMQMKKYDEAKSAFEKSASVGPNAGKENKVQK